MGFLFGFLMFVCSYLMVGPILIGAYVLQHSKDRQQIEEKTKALLICIALYVVVWVIALCVQTILNHIVWVVVGAIIGAICSYVTYDKNKKQAVVNSDTHKSFVSSSPQGTDELFNYISSLINKNGINYIDEQFEVPYMAIIIRYFNKSKVEFIINRFNPHLNIKFNCDGTESGLLELVSEIDKEEMFRLLVDKGVRYKNYNQVLLSLINAQNYQSLKYLTDHTKVDFNIPLSDNNLIICANLFEGKTILDYALANNAHEYIIDLIKQKGGKRSCDIELINNEDEIVIEQNVDDDLNRKAFNEFVKEVKSSLVKDVVNSIEEINTRIANVWKGNEDVFSKAEIVQFALNLKSFKEKLSKEMYDKVIELYNVYQGKEYCIYQKYNLLAMQYEIKMIQDEFSQLIDREITSSGDVI